MQAQDFVKFVDLFAAAQAAQSGKLDDKIKELKAASTEWDKRNGLAEEMKTLEAAKMDLINLKADFAKQQDDFKAAVTSFNAKVDTAAKTDMARKEALAKQLATVEAKIASLETTQAAFSAAVGKHDATMAEKEKAIAAAQLEVDRRNNALNTLEAKLNKAQNLMAGALR